MQESIIILLQICICRTIQVFHKISKVRVSKKIINKITKLFLDNYSNQELKQEMVEEEINEQKQTQFDEISYPGDDSMNLSQSQNDENSLNIPDIDYENKGSRKKGRPKGAKSGIRTSQINIKKSKLFNDGQKQETPEFLPKMKSNVYKIRLTPEQIEELKKENKSFSQPGVCYVIAPSLEKCIECSKLSKRSVKFRGEVDCRFFQFRKLRYEDDNLIVDGFLEDSEAKDIDIAVWLPQEKTKHKSLSFHHARLIISHVGDELCNLIAKEKVYYEKFKSDTKPLIWKRLIDGVLEICDLCSTTLFNYHFICTKCGLSLCVECVNEKNELLFKAPCSIKEHEHSYEELHFTKIIVGNCMDELQRYLHDITKVWDIQHDCKVKTEPIIEIDKLLKTVIKNIRLDDDGEGGKSFISRELNNLFKIIDVDLSTIKMDENSKTHDECIKLQRRQLPQQHLRPVKYHTNSGRENVISISRSMSQATSNLFYKVPHRWLCENKLLRLLDPLHSGNDEFFHQQWQRGLPVLISNVLDHLKKELWMPQSFSNEFGDEKSDFINCMTGNLVRNKEIAVFWDGFEIVDRRLKDNEGKPMLLKLKDWPPDSDFKNLMPSRFEDVMKNLPMNQYTNRIGDLNIVKYLPSCIIHPDLGPKGYFAYGSPFYLKEGTTNLHLDIADACNVMVYIGFPRDKDITIDQYIEQGFKAILEADCDIANINRVIRDGEIPGAIWHIFLASDTDKIRDFLLKVAYEKGYKVNFKKFMI
jgi:[histone H3]-dimethyl-L-lysine9 demethylase